MGISFDKLKLAAILSLASWGLLFAEQFGRVDALTSVTPWVPLLLAVAAILVMLRARRSGSVRLAIVAASGLVLFAGLSLIAIHRDTDEVRQLWRRAESRSITSILLAVAERVEHLQELSASIGEQSSDFFQREGASPEDTLGFRLEAFRLLDNQAQRIQTAGELPPGTEIGIQLFDRDGKRLAWAGWPQPLFAQDQRFVASGKTLLYSRQVSLYQILTHVIPLHDRLGDLAATLIIDMPLEVNYRVNNKFLKSTSFAEDIGPGSAANVRFDYSPTLPNLPYTIDSFRENLRAREQEIERQARERGNADSLLTYQAFPATLKPLGEISGEETVGLSGRALIHSQLGNPLFTITVTSHPFRYFLENHTDKFRIQASVLILLALLIYFVLSLAVFPRRIAGPAAVVKAIYFVGVLVLIRYWLIWLLPGLFQAPHRLFNPAIFATPILGGLMRSAGDLLITAVFFVIALYGLLKITRNVVAVEGAEEEPAHRSHYWFLLKGAFAAAVLLGAFEVAHRFVSSVVVNANPRLVGETMRLFESSAVVLHLAVFLMTSGIFLAGMIGIWGVYRLGSRADKGKASLTAAILIMIATVFLWRWEAALFLSLLVLFVVFAPRLVMREDLVSNVLAAFSFVVIVSTVVYVFLNEEYQALQQTFVRERVEELTHPSDNWKVFILEDVLENFSQDVSIRQALSMAYPTDVQRLAFDLWAGSSLSLLGYSSAIHVFDERDSLVSRFTVEMPYRVNVLEATERLETASSQEWMVLDLTTRTPAGIVRFYRGIVNIGSPAVGGDGQTRGAGAGKVVVDIPFFFESLAWAARTGPQTPEVLRNVQEGGVEPRLEEPEALLLARLRGRRVIESSSDVLPAGFAFPEEELDKGIGLEWPLLQTSGASYRYLVEEGEDSGRYLLAGFRVPDPLQHLLRWSTILSLYFFFTVCIIVLIILMKGLPFLGVVLPTLTPGRQMGFQQKLLASFLVVALLPSVILGVFSIGLIKDRFVEESRKEALYKSFSARKSVSNLLMDELGHLLEYSDLEKLTAGGLRPHSPVDEDRLTIVFVDTQEPVGNYQVVHSSGDANRGGDETGAPGGRPVQWSVTGLLDRFSYEQPFVHSVDGQAYLAMLSKPLSLKTGNEWKTFLIYYARKLNGELLGAIADQVGADVNVYNRGELIATSREGLLFGGFISSMMNADAFVKVSLMNVDQSLAAETAGRYRYEVAYLPLPTADPAESAALGLPLLFRPESYHGEIQKASSIVLSIFALLSAVTMGLGLLLARGIFEPLKGLLEGTKRISRGDLAFELPSKRGDEIGTVIEAFNEMTGQLSKSQTALEERRRYLEVILANIGTGVISTDASDRILSVNNAAERILNIRSVQVMGRAAQELVQQDVVPEFFALLANPPSGDEPLVSSEIDITMDGHSRTIKYVRTRLSTDGRYLGTVYVFEDLTELINSKKLSAWVEMARQIAHEIKNPLTPIKLSAQFMVKAHEEKASDFGKIFKQSSETILKQVEVLRHIASEFSSFGRMQQLELVRENVVSVIDEWVAPYKTNTTGVEIIMESTRDDLEALVDREALRKICINLIENAMEAMPGGGRLEIMCTQTTEDGEEWTCVSFRDTGPGLSDDVKQKLFEPYFSTKTTGTGLGLAICRSLSREMGGDVIVGNVAGGKGVEAVLYLKPAGPDG